MRSPAFPEFRARAPWWGPDLQTLRNLLREGRGGPLCDDETQLLLPLADGSGDALSGALAHPDEPRGGPLVVLIHGLSGSQDSAYVRRSARHWLSRGHPVLRLNLRGAGDSLFHCRDRYHAGRSEDLRAALDALDPEWLRDGLVLVGYSLGGNMLLKFLAESGRSFPVIAGASVSAPIDLAAASRRFLDRRNAIYHRHLLRAMKDECFVGKTELSDREAAAIRGARSIFEFDERFVAPRNGYRDAAHYYEENRALRFLPSIEVPTLAIHALDDPWIPARAYTDFEWQRNPRLVPLLARGGGHVGFHDRRDRLPWHDRCIAQFVDSL